MKTKEIEQGGMVYTIVRRSTEAVMINEFALRLSMLALLNVRFRARNRPPLSDFIRLIESFADVVKKIDSKD